jgi:hypothetical protein
MRLALLALAALLFVAIRVPFVSLPLERDEGEYAYIAWRALEGDVPYRDAFDQKPPGVFAAYLAAFALFGRSVEAIHAFLYLWTAATALALYAWVRRAVDADAAAFAALLFAVVSIDPSLVATAANTEIFMLLPLTASAWLALRAKDSDGAWAWLGCGALAAAACWFKPVAIWNAVFLGLYAVGDAVWARRGRAALRRGALLALGAGAVSAPVFATFAALGALEPFLDAVFLHNLAYAARLSASSGVRNAAASLAHLGPSLGIAAALALLALAWPPALSRRARVFLGGFAVASLVGVSSGLYFRLHYFVQAVPVLAALAGASAAALARALPGGAAPRLALAALLAAPPLVVHRDLFSASPDAISREIYGMNPFVEAPRLADYIQRTSRPEDTVFVVGSEPQVLFHAERRSATRYIFFYPLTGPFSDVRERQQEVMREVRAARPLYVVWVNLPTSMLMMPHSERWIFDATLELLRREYRIELIVRPTPGGDPRRGTFDFVWGSRAVALFAEAQEEDSPMPWVAVFRRIR